MESITLPTPIKNLYPFKTQKFETMPGIFQSYVDEGNIENEAILLIHGNPTWSFFYRNLILGLKNNYRVIAPDHIGCGLSDKPDHFSYQLKDHVENLKRLVNHLGIKKFHLIVHDWGGAIGSGLAISNPSQVLSVTYMNTAAFTSSKIPWTIDLLRKNSWGEWFIRTFNGFAGPATFMAVNKPLTKEIKAGYLYPYNDYASRIATAKFVKDIPMSSDHPSFKTLKAIEEKLPTLNCPKLLLWGEKDFCFTMDFFKRFKEIFPEAQTKILNDAGHYLLEDSPETSLETIIHFLANQPKSSAIHH